MVFAPTRWSALVVKFVEPALASQLIIAILWCVTLLVFALLPQLTVTTTTLALKTHVQCWECSIPHVFTRLLIATPTYHRVSMHVPPLSVALILDATNNQSLVMMVTHAQLIYATFLEATTTLARTHLFAPIQILATQSHVTLQL